MGQSICSEDPCDRPVRARGLCGAHYERLRMLGPLGPLPARPPKPLKDCQVQCCPNRAIARGWCEPHYRHWRNHGDPVAVGGTPPRVCSEHECGRPHSARGLCWAHAERQRKTGVVGGPIAEYDYPDTCVVDRCPKPMKAQGYCAMHYDRWKKTGDLGSAESTFQPVKGLICKLEGCIEPRRARGLCQGHYRRERVYGDPGPAQLKRRKRTGGPCEVERCPEKAQAGGMCSMHYARKLKYGDPGGVGRQLAPKGAGHVDQNGYRVIYVDGKSVLEHRHVMALHLGRPLTANETVHHRHGDRSRNTIDQLELWWKGQPSGQRVSDLIAYIAEFHADAVKAEIRRLERERRTGQLRLADMPAAHVSEAS